jgi:hypothetical protein
MGVKIYLNTQKRVILYKAGQAIYSRGVAIAINLL